MPEPRLDAHGSDTVRALFEEDTNEVKTIGDIVEKHAGDSLILTPNTRGDRTADGGEADFEEDALPTDPAERWESLDDSFPGSDSEDDEGIGETDMTGTAPGIARGFGSHVPIDLGADGFQIEELPDRIVTGGIFRGVDEELDDYDDSDDQNGKFDSKELVDFEQPGDNAVGLTEDDEKGTRKPVSFDEQLDSSFIE
jgi:hypothetical protein